MQQLISAAEFRERFDIDSDIDEKRIVPHIGAASRRLRQWVGDEKYGQAATEGSEYEDLQEDLKNAEAHLTFHFAIRGMNFPLSGKGILATAMSTEAKEVRRYLTPDETEKVATQMLELAREIAGPYMPESEDTSFVVITDDCSTGEATTRNCGQSYC